MTKGTRGIRGLGLALLLVWTGIAGGCKDPGKTSLEGAKGHVRSLVAATQADVDDIRKGLPEGAKQLARLWAEKAPGPTTPAPAAPEGDAGVANAGESATAPSASGSAAAPAAVVPGAGDAGVGVGSGDAGSDREPADAAPTVAAAEDAATGLVDGGTATADAGAAPVAAPSPPDASTVRSALEQAREKVQALRVAKSTFFALTDARGIVLRNDQDQDLMVGKGLFEAYPDLKRALSGKYVETTGSMEEAATIKNRPDAQWVAAQPVSVAGQPRGLYVTGWGWSAYARRLQLSVVSEIQDQLQPGQHEPLVYVVVVAGDRSYGWDVPDVTLEYINGLNLVTKVKGDEVHGEVAEITGRRWGLAAAALPAFSGMTVIGVVARSET